MPNARNRLWLELSAALFRETIPAKTIIALGKETPATHAFLASREARRVDSALESMALAAGESEVRATVAALSHDTLAALASRWANFIGIARAKANDPTFRLWFPPGDRDTWRVIMLSLLTDREAATAHLKALWGEAAPTFLPED